MRAIRSEESEVRPSSATCTIKTLTYIIKIKHSDLSLISSSSFSCLVLFLMSLTIRYDNLVTYCRWSDQKTRDVLVYGIVAACLLLTVVVFIVICWRRESRIKRSLQLSVLLSSPSLTWNVEVGSFFQRFNDLYFNILFCIGFGLKAGSLRIWGKNWIN